MTGVFAPVAVDDAKPREPFVAGRCAHRSNMPAQSSTTRMVEDWRPEVLVLVGIGGGIVRARLGDGGIEWEGPSLSAFTELSARLGPPRNTGLSPPQQERRAAVERVRKLQVALRADRGCDI